MKKLKGNFVLIFTIAITCFLLFMAVSMQFKLVDTAQSSNIENMRKQDLTTEIASLNEKYSDLEKRAQEIEQTLEQYKSSDVSNTDTKKVLEEELEKLQLILGLTNVEGPGVKIVLENTDNVQITDEKLILLVNNLKSAGAEAISINGNRIVQTSEIVNIDNYSDFYINVNQNIINPPYEIYAIGDSITLQTSLTQIGGQLNNLKQLGIDYKIEKQDKIIITKYDKSYDSSYLTKEE